MSIIVWSGTVGIVSSVISGSSTVVGVITSVVSWSCTIVSVVASVVSGSGSISGVSSVICGSSTVGIVGAVASVVGWSGSISVVAGIVGWSSTISVVAGIVGWSSTVGGVTSVVGWSCTVVGTIVALTTLRLVVGWSWCITAAVASSKSRVGGLASTACVGVVDISGGGDIETISTDASSTSDSTVGDCAVSAGQVVLAYFNDWNDWCWGLSAAAAAKVSSSITSA